MREGAPVKLWGLLEACPGPYGAVGAPGPETFTLRVHDDGQHLCCPSLPGP
jgi:hypothetical protein